MDLESQAKEYTVSVRTNDIHEAIATAASALYSLVEEGLQVHEAHEAEECEFEEFARDVLGNLSRRPRRDVLASISGKLASAGFSSPLLILGPNNKAL